MTTENALNFLKRNQPMPPDAKLSQELIDEYDNVRKFFIKQKDNRCIPLFLNSFGQISGFGVYQLVEDVICQYASEEVVPHLKESLNSMHYSVQYWSEQISINFPSEEFIIPLKNNLTIGDFDLKYFALASLGQIQNVAVEEIVQDFICSETDVELRQFADEILQTFPDRAR